MTREISVGALLEIMRSIADHIRYTDTPKKFTEYTVIVPAFHKGLPGQTFPMTWHVDEKGKVPIDLIIYDDYYDYDGEKGDPVAHQLYFSKYKVGLWEKTEPIDNGCRHMSITYRWRKNNMIGERMEVQNAAHC